MSRVGLEKTVRVGDIVRCPSLSNRSNVSLDSMIWFKVVLINNACIELETETGRRIPMERSCVLELANEQETIDFHEACRISLDRQFDRFGMIGLAAFNA